MRVIEGQEKSTVTFEYKVQATCDHRWRYNYYYHHIFPFIESSGLTDVYFTWYFERDYLWPRNEEIHQLLKATDLFLF